jgi:transposase
MRRSLFWLSDEQWVRIEPHLPRDIRGVEPGGRPLCHQRHRSCAEKRLSLVPSSAECGPPTTIYSRSVIL